MTNPNPYPCLLTNSNLFQPNAQESTCCFNDAAMCKSVEKSHPGLNEGISPCSIGKLKVHPHSLILQLISQETFWNHCFLWTLSGCLLVVYPRTNMGNHSYQSVLGHTSTSGYHTRYFDSPSTKSVNDGGPFCFPMESGDISSLNPGWDFPTFQQRWAETNQSLSKCKDMDLDFSLT